MSCGQVVNAYQNDREQHEDLTQKDYFFFRTHGTEQMPRSPAAAAAAAAVAAAAAAVAAAVLLCVLRVSTVICCYYVLLFLLFYGGVVSCVIYRMKCHRTRG